MKKAWAIVVIGVLVLLLFATERTMAANQGVHVEWDYPQGVTDLAGFRLYVDGGMLCNITDKTLRAADCSGVVPDGPGNYTMTAYTTSNQESVQSPKVVFDPPPPAPGIKDVRGK